MKIGLIVIAYLLMGCTASPPKSVQREDPSEVGIQETTYRNRSPDNSLSPSEMAAGWELLWNGKSKDGWRAIYLDHFPKTGWIIRNGNLICLGEELPNEQRGGAIITEQKYGSFELSFDFKIQEGANSGIKYFIDERLKAGMGHGLGLEYAILDDENFPYPDKDAKRTCGSLYDLVKAKPGATRPVGKWNCGKIVVDGNHIEHWLNGKKVVQVEKGTPHYYDLVAESKYKNIEGWGEFTRGHILIQDEGPRTAFRNIKIRPVKQDPAVSSAASGKDPNILFIYLDDLGYGDLRCTNPDSKIPTPHIDRLANQGLLFTDAHTPAAVCGPSRYGLLTGRYPWRRGPGGMGNGAKFREVFIEENRLTIASLLKQKGYNTAQFGKWGLRHNYSQAVLPGRDPGDLDAYDFKNNRLLGPQLFGFDYTWTLTYLDKENSDIKQPFENGKPLHQDLSPLDPHDWFPDSAHKIMDYLQAYAGGKSNAQFGANPEKPFFVYWDPTGPHWPYVPNREFVGKTDAGVYGDFVFEIDHWVGQVLNTLKVLNLEQDTLVLFASDNGPDKYSYERLEEIGHYNMGKWRGLKTDVFEGGHRTPMIVRWPGVVMPDRQSEALISLTDWFDTIAEITGQEIPQGAGEDSMSFLSLLKEDNASTHRQSIIHHSTRGDFAIRQGNWVFIDSANAPNGEPEWFRQLRGIEPDNQAGQLFNLEEDPSQTRNLYAKYPEKVQELKQLLLEGKSTL